MSVSWLALHTFCEQEQDALLLEALLPELRALEREAALGRWFFLRYGNGGPHLRLRVECRQPHDRVTARLVAAGREHLDQTAATRASNCDWTWVHETEKRLGIDDEALEPLEDPQRYRSIQLREYVFDERRYGTGAAREDAHDHFCVSSEIAVTVLARSRHNRDRRRTFALFAAAALPASGDGSLAEWAELFAEAASWAAPAAPLTAGVAAQHDPLSDVRRLLRGADPAWPQPWKAIWLLWRDEVRRRHRALCSEPIVHESRLPADHLLLDALHLLCNRLGLGLAEECYVYEIVAGLLRSRPKLSAAVTVAGATR